MPGRGGGVGRDGHLQIQSGLWSASGGQREVQ